MVRPGHDNNGRDAHIWITHGVKVLTSAGAPVIVPVTSAGGPAGATVGPPGGRADLTSL